MLQQPNSQKVPVANQQYVQQQNGGGHKGPNLSLSSPSVGMSLCNQRQTTAQDYSGLELALPWLRTTSDYGGSSHRPPPAMDNILHPIISHEKANVEAFSAFSVQNFLPLTGKMSSRELGSWQWMVGSSDSASSLEAGQQMFFSCSGTPYIGCIVGSGCSFCSDFHFRLNIVLWLLFFFLGKILSNCTDGCMKLVKFLAILMASIVSRFNSVRNRTARLP